MSECRCSLCLERQREWVEQDKLNAQRYQKALEDVIDILTDSMYSEAQRIKKANRELSRMFTKNGQYMTAGEAKAVLLDELAKGHHPDKEKAIALVDALQQKGGE